MDIRTRTKQCEKHRRREVATGTFVEARAAALQGGMILMRHTEQHYSLRERRPRGWILHVYPGNRRLYRDKGRPVRTPFLALPAHWSLRDVVRAAVKAAGKGAAS